MLGHAHVELTTQIRDDILECRDPAENIIDNNARPRCVVKDSTFSLCVGLPSGIKVVYKNNVIASYDQNEPGMGHW